MKLPQDHRRAFVFRDLIVVIIILAVLLVMGAVISSVLNYARRSAAQMTDARQIADIQRAMTIWAKGNGGFYPLPSLIDAADATVVGPPTSKNTTANILSILVYGGGCAPNELVSVSEVNPMIREYARYQFEDPSAAARPADAMWDPALAADFTSPSGGNVSYAHIAPVDIVLTRWRDDVSSTHPVIANRGPEISTLARDKDGRATAGFVRHRSNTSLIHGSPRAWEGNIGFNDGHVTFEARLDPDQVTYRNETGVKLTDCLFFDEPDDPTGANTFMSIWTKAGMSKAEFKGIWD